MVEMGPWEQYCSPSFKVIPGWFIFSSNFAIFWRVKIFIPIKNSRDYRCVRLFIIFYNSLNDTSVLILVGVFLNYILNIYMHVYICNTYICEHIYVQFNSRVAGLILRDYCRYIHQEIINKHTDCSIYIYMYIRRHNSGI